MVIQATEQIARQYTQAGLNKKEWGSLGYNAIVEGVIEGGVVDTTSKLQTLINKAIAAGRRTIFLPHITNGKYYVTTLTNADQVDFIGDNSSFVGGYSGTIEDLGGTTSREDEATSRGINIKYPPIPFVGAVGDGVTNDSAVINAILSFAGLNGMSVEIPDGIFFATGLISSGCKYIFGHGENSVIKSAGSSDTITLDTDKTTVSNITFLGNLSFTQNGISISYAFNCKVIDCTFRNMGTNGVYLTQIGLGDRGSRDGATISRCSFYNCYRGITCDANAEYVNILDCVFQEFCGWAIWTVAGNTIIDGCNIVKCINGIYLGTVTNGGHGTITSCNINHIFNGTGDMSVGYALWIEGITAGEIISNVAIFEANIMIKNAKCIKLVNCELAVVQYLFDNASSCEICDSILYDSYAHPTLPIVNNHNGNASFVSWHDNLSIDGTYKSGIENIKGGQVVGTAKGQTVANGGGDVVGFNVVVNSANYPNTTKYPDWWTTATNKAKNKGFGGGKVKVNVQIYVTYGAGADTTSTLATLHLGSKLYTMNPIRYGLTSVYYTFNGDILSDVNDDIWIDLVNNSGQVATVTTSNSRLLIEGI